MSHIVTMSLALAASAACPCQQDSAPTTSVFRPTRTPSHSADTMSWESYRGELDRLWREYKTAGSTTDGFTRYKAAATEVKRRYIYGDEDVPTVAP